MEHRLQRSPAAAALTRLTSPTFPDDPTPQTSRRLSIYPPPHRRRANPVMRLFSFPPPNSFLRECTTGSRIVPSGSFVRRVLITHFERRDRNRALDCENEMFSYLSFSLSSRCLFVTRFNFALIGRDEVFFRGGNTSVLLPYSRHGTTRPFKERISIRALPYPRVSRCIPWVLISRILILGVLDRRERKGARETVYYRVVYREKYLCRGVCE